MSHQEHSDVAISGGGVAGLSAGIFTARHDLETIVLSAGGSLLRRNAHLENYPGFPAGVNSRLLLGMLRDQAERSDCEVRDTEVTRIEPTDADNGFSIETASSGVRSAAYVNSLLRTTAVGPTSTDYTRRAVSRRSLIRRSSPPVTASRSR